MDELTAGRSGDARIAVAMGWTNVGQRPWLDKGLKLQGCRMVQAFPGKSRNLTGVVPKFTTDPAQVVPMMERIGDLAKRQVGLQRLDKDDWSVCVDDATYTALYLDGEFAGATANLAAAQALLAVWEEANDGH